jgi:3-deoxy-manno-octulosonate cytidylyltransferase (CMP-KDO synthetase)
MTTDRPSVIAVIPARYASVRLPGKPLIDLGGKTMIQRVFERVRGSELVGETIVATDDERIAASVRAGGGEAVMTDPDLESGSDRVAAAVSGREGDIVVNVQGDEPLMPPELIDETIRGLLQSPRAGVATPARTITDMQDIVNPNCVKVVADHTGRALYFSRSPIPYLRDAESSILSARPGAHLFMKHIGLYVYRRETLERFVAWEKTPLEEAERLEQLRLLEHGVWIQIVRTNYDSIPVDTADDADRIRGILSSLSE